MSKNRLWINDLDLHYHWQKPYRYYHNLKYHLEPMLQKISDFYDKGVIIKKEYIILSFAAWFHNIIYFPWKNNNVEKSIEFFEDFINDKERYISKNIDELYGLTKDDIEIIKQLIIGTKKHTILDKSLQGLFNSINCNYFYSNDMKELLDIEYLLFKENQFLSFEQYKKNRINFIEENILYLVNNNNNNDIWNKIINWLKSWKPKIGIYAGTFEPFHIGHYNILTQAEKIFDKVVILKTTNSNKNTTPISNNLSDDINPKIKNREIAILPSNVIITQYIRDYSDWCNCTLIRGIRDVNDYHYETNYIECLKDLYGNHLQTILIPSKKEFNHINSTMIKQIYDINPNKIERYISLSDRM